MAIITTSFDNGPDPEVTPQVLDTLRRHEIKSTFFLVGNKLRDRRCLAQRAMRKGTGSAITPITTGTARVERRERDRRP
jgi:hypothetical protein